MPFDLPPPVHYLRTPVIMRLIAKTNDANLAAPVQDYSKKVPSVSKSDVDTFVPAVVTDLSNDTFKYLPISKMKLMLPNWVTRRPWYDCGGESYLLEVGPKSDKSALLYFNSDGVAGDTDAGLGKVLKEPAHFLTVAEKLSFDPQIQPKEIAYTQALNGKMILVRQSSFQVKRRYVLKFNHNPDSSGVFVPAKIVFEAKPAQYKRYINQIKACLQTIKWNDKVTIVP
ncbi:MAG: hypothetical protein IPP97_26585 [Candidatus Obscuribacter sp.]|nr:hypothetical protein [Candidatus Obscuribacter sp.]